MRKWMTKVTGEEMNERTQITQPKFKITPEKNTLNMLKIDNI